RAPRTVAQRKYDPRGRRIGHVVALETLGLVLVRQEISIDVRSVLHGRPSSMASPSRGGATNARRLAARSAWRKPRLGARKTGETREARHRSKMLHGCR